MDSYMQGLAAWDLGSFFGNAANYAKTVGGGFLTLMGVIALIMGGYRLVNKLMNPQKEQTGWVMIGALILVGGALMVGGINIIITIGSGGQQTVNDLGGGIAMLGMLVG